MVEELYHCCFEVCPGPQHFLIAIFPAKLVAHAAEFGPRSILGVMSEVRVAGEKVANVVGGLGHGGLLQVQHSHDVRGGPQEMKFRQFCPFEVLLQNQSIVAIKELGGKGETAPETFIHTTVVCGERRQQG